MTERFPQKYEPRQLAADTTVFTGYLQQFGLPTDSIIASTAERMVLVSNLPHFLSTLPAEEKREARYLAKFVGATTIGLFKELLDFLLADISKAYLAHRSKTFQELSAPFIKRR
jgi:hypothetical protein